MFDPGKFRKIAAPAGDFGKPDDFRDWRIRVRSGSQFRTENQFWNTHRLVDEDLFLIFAALTPLQDRFDCNDGRLEFEDALQK